MKSQQNMALNGRIESVKEQPETRGAVSGNELVSRSTAQLNPPQLRDKLINPKVQLRQSSGSSARATFGKPKDLAQLREKCDRENAIFRQNIIDLRQTIKSPEERTKMMNYMMRNKEKLQKYKSSVLQKRQKITSIEMNSAKERKAYEERIQELMIKSNKQEAKIKRLKEELKLKVSMRRCDELYAKISKMGAIIEDYDSQFATIHSQKELTQNEDNAAAAGLQVSMHIDTSNVLQDIPNMLVRTHRSIEILKLQEEIDDLQQKCSELDELIRAKDMLLEAKNQEICKLKDSSQGMDDMIHRNNDEWQKKLKKLTKELEQRTERVTAMEGKQGQVQKEMEQLLDNKNRAFDKLQHFTKELEERLASKQAQLDALQEQYRDAKIAADKQREYDRRQFMDLQAEYKNNYQNLNNKMENLKKIHDRSEEENQMLKHKVERLEADLKEKIEEMEDAKAVLMQMDTIENIHEERERMEAMRREFVENARLAQEQIEDLQIQNDELRAKMDIKMHSLSRSEDEAMKMADEAPISSGYYRKLKLKESMLRSNQMLLDSKCSQPSLNLISKGSQSEQRISQLQAQNSQLRRQLQQMIETNTSSLSRSNSLNLQEQRSMARFSGHQQINIVAKLQEAEQYIRELQERERELLKKYKAEIKSINTRYEECINYKTSVISEKNSQHYEDDEDADNHQDNHEDKTDDNNSKSKQSVIDRLRIKSNAVGSQSPVDQKNLGFSQSKIPQQHSEIIQNRENNLSKKGKKHEGGSQSRQSDQQLSNQRQRIETQLRAINELCEIELKTLEQKLDKVQQERTAALKECALTVQTLKNIQQEGESLLAENISLREERDKLKCRLEEQAKHQIFEYPRTNQRINQIGDASNREDFNLSIESKHNDSSNLGRPKGKNQSKKPAIKLIDPIPIKESVELRQSESKDSGLGDSPKEFSKVTAELQRQKQKIMKELQAVKEQLQTVNQEMQTVREEFAKLQQVYKDKIKQQEGQITSMAAQIESLQQELESRPLEQQAVDEPNDEEERRNELQSRITNAPRSMRNHSDAMNEQNKTEWLQSQLEENKSKIRIYQDQLYKKENRLDTAARIMVNYQAKLEELELQRKRLTSSKESAEKEISRLTQEVKNATLQIEKLNKEAQQSSIKHKNENDSVRKRIAELQEQLQTSKTELQFAREKLKQSEKFIDKQDQSENECSPMKQPSAFKEIEGVPLSCPSDTVKEINSEADIDDLLGKIRLLTDFMEKYNRTESTAKKEQRIREQMKNSLLEDLLNIIFYRLEKETVVINEKEQLNHELARQNRMLIVSNVELADKVAKMEAELLQQKEELEKASNLQAEQKNESKFMQLKQATVIKLKENASKEKLPMSKKEIETMTDWHQEKSIEQLTSAVQLVIQSAFPVQLITNSDVYELKLKIDKVIAEREQKCLQFIQKHEMVVAELIQSICPPTFDFTYMPQVLALLAKQFTVLEVDTILAEEAKGKHNQYMREFLESEVCNNEKWQYKQAASLQVNRLTTIQSEVYLKPSKFSKAMHDYLLTLLQAESETEIQRTIKSIFQLMYRYEQTVLKKLEESQLIVRQRTSELKRINDSSMDVSKQSSPNTSK